MPLMVDVDTHAKADRVDEMDCEPCGGHCFRHPYWRYFYWLHDRTCPRWSEAQSAVVIPSGDPFKEGKPFFDRNMGTWRPPPTQMVQYPIQLIPTPWWESRRKLAYGPRCPLCDAWPLAEHRRDCLLKDGGRLGLLHPNGGLLQLLRDLYAWGPDIDFDSPPMPPGEWCPEEPVSDSARPTGRTEYRITCPHCAAEQVMVIDPSIKTIGMCCHCEGPSWTIFEGVRPTPSVESPPDRDALGDADADGDPPSASATRLPPGLEPDRLPVQPDGGTEIGVQRREERSEVAAGQSPRPSADACEWGVGRSGAPEARSGGAVPRSGLDRSHEGPPCRSCGYLPPVHADWCGA